MVDRFARAQHEGQLDERLEPAHLGPTAQDPTGRERRRAFVVEAARRLASPR